MQRSIGRPISSILAALSLAGTLHASAAPLKGPALAEPAATAVLQEIESMVRTQENKVHQFVVREATPARIEQLYNSPQLLRQSTSIRQNGLIFAGSGKLLSFDKPSDVLARMESWFPEEFAATRASKEQSFFMYIHLFGPYQSWDAEPAAFMALWKCMPQIAWIRPGANPFMRRLGHDLAFMAIGARSNSDYEYDFGHCIGHRAGYQSAWTEAEIPRTLEHAKNVADKVTPVLIRKFAQLLANNRCRGTGPDDCVLALRHWASLAPADPGLAKAMQALEPELGLERPAPQPPETPAPRGADGLPQYDDIMRQAAYLRAKLQSVLGAPSAWPATALAATLRQMTALRIAAIAAMKHQEMLYELDYRNERFSPWSEVAGRVDKVPALKDAVLAELNRLGPQPIEDCPVFAQWIKHAGTSIPSEYALPRLGDKPGSRCVAPNWEWLASDKPGAGDVRARYLASLNATESGVVRQLMLEHLTNNGAACFGKQADARPWLRDLCCRWISEPQTVPFKLKHSKLVLDKHQHFRVTRTEQSNDDGKAASRQTAWLRKLVDGMGAQAARGIADVAADLEKRKLLVREAALWRHPKSAPAFLELALSNNESTHLYFSVGPAGISAFDVPERFRGHNDSTKIVQVSDLDADGNLELWWSEGFNECEGNENDRKRRIDCSATSADMGEISGDSLGYFVKSAASPFAKAAASPSAVSMKAPEAQEPEKKSCNTALVAPVLQRRLRINFGDEENGEGSDLVDLACRAHPVHPERTIVALFHHLRDKKGEVLEDAKGFAMAIIDIGKDRVLQLYRDTREVDGATRINGGDLRLDTARYNLAPGVRALGVRMNIAHGPKCAEGGSDGFLTLFVEEGAKLRPVLRDLAMSSWSLEEGSPCGTGNEPTVIDSIERSITVLPGVTDGWHDLQIVEQHTIDTYDGEKEIKPVKRTARGPVLRATGKLYSGF